MEGGLFWDVLGMMRTRQQRGFAAANAGQKGSCVAMRLGMDTQIAAVVCNLNRSQTGAENTTAVIAAYDSMKKRCYNPSEPAYKNYGAIGIIVCDDWLNSFVSFRNWALSNGYSDGLSIDRIDNDGNYSPENCRWVDAKTQCNNRRNNRYITFAGKTHTISEWSAISGISKDVISYRIKAGWGAERTLTEKVRVRRWRKKPKDL